jgi:hypothetical protein
MGRGPGWPTVLGLVLVAMTFSVVDPVQLVAIPLALLLVGLPPRPVRVVVMAAALVALVFIGARSSFWYAERGWTLLVAGWFVLAVVVWPGASFIARAVAATGAAAVSSALVIAVRGGWAELDHTIASHYREVAVSIGRSWPGAPLDAERFMVWAGEFPARVFPSLLGIASLAALALAWWLYRRLTGAGEPLGTLVEFRFPDALVWVLIVGLVLLLAPSSDSASRAGANLVMFMGALYALRGLGVTVALVLALVGSKVMVLVALGLVALLLYPIVVAGTLLLGVTDTWLDLRSGRRAANEEG